MSILISTDSLNTIQGKYPLFTQNLPTIKTRQKKRKKKKKVFLLLRYMLFDRFLLAVESRDLSQTDKSIIRVSSFPKMSDG